VGEGEKPASLPLFCRFTWPLLSQLVHADSLAAELYLSPSIPVCPAGTNGLYQFFVFAGPVQSVYNFVQELHNSIVGLSGVR
jgi:hypothetical protein